MSYDENEKLIKETLNTIKTPRYDFRDGVRKNITHKSHFRQDKRKMKVILVAALISILSFTVLASTLPSFNRLLSKINPEIASRLQVIEEKDINKAQAEFHPPTNEVESKKDTAMKAVGIEIKPLAVLNDEDMMMIYLTIQDVAEDRLDETLSVQDYFIEGAYINNSQIIDYNEDNKTAIVQFTTQGGEALNHTTIKLRIESLLTGKQTLERVPIPISLAEVKDMSGGASTWMSRKDTQGGGGSGDMWNRLEEQGRIEVLKPNQMDIHIPGIDRMYISNIGFIDDRLHIQTRWEERDDYSHGHFYLVDKDENKMEIKENNFSFAVDETSNEVKFGDDYIEYILEINEEQAKDTQLLGYFAGYSEIIEGDWDLEIDLASDVEIIKVPCAIQKETWQIQEVAVSPLGVTLRGVGDKPNVEQMKCSIKMKNGEIKAFDSVHTSNQLGEILIKFVMNVPLNTSEIESVQIDKDFIELETN